MTVAGAMVLIVLIICTTIYAITKLHADREKEREQKKDRNRSNVDRV